MRAAKGARENNAALASTISGIWMAIEDGRLRAEFQLRPLDDRTAPSGLAQVLSQDLAGRRMTLPPSASDPNEIDLTRAVLSEKQGDEPW